MSSLVNRVKGLILVSLCMVACFMGTNAIAAQQVPTIVVLPFQVNGGPELQQAANSLPEIIGHSLISRGARVVPQSVMYEAIQKNNVSTLDAAVARRIASQTGANHALIGTISQVGTALSIDARLVPVGGGTARPFFVDQSSGARDLNSAAAELASKVSSQFASSDSIAGVEVRGTRVLDPEVVLMRVSARAGDHVDPALIDRDMKALWDLGYFSDVRVEVERQDKGLVLVYTVVEKPRIENVAVEGATEVDADDILDVMSTKQGAIYNERLVAEDIQKIIELYRKKGFSVASVTPRVDMRPGGSNAALIMTVNEGKKLYIKDVLLEGVSQLSPGDVKSEMLLEPRGWLSWIDGSGVMREELIERDATAITSYYLEHGFIDVIVAAARLDYQEDGIVITFPIEEGTRYTLGEVSFAGDLIESADVLRGMTELHKLAARNEHFKLSVMQADERVLTDYYAKHGYGFADINPTPRKSTTAAGVVDVIYHIGKKQQLYIGRVLVEGNDKTRDNVILREMRLTDGDKFDGDKLRRSNERLQRLGFFEMAEIELVPTATEDEVDLRVKVKEQPTGALMFGVGYSTFSSVGVAGTIMERNLFGKGYSLALQSSFNARRNAYMLSFTNPRLYDTDLGFGLDAYHWRDDYLDYRKKTTGATVRFSYPLGEYTAITVGYRFDQYEMYDMDWDVSPLIRAYDTGTRYTSVGLLRLGRNSTDHRNPTKGHIDRLSLDYGGGLLGGDDDFVLVSAEHQTFYELWKNHVLHGRIKGAALLKNGSKEPPIFERFWMGGIDSVRGYNARDIVPVDPNTDDHIGGTRMAFANLEYIWTFSEELGFAIVPFFDMGINVDHNQKWNWQDDMKRSFGAELRWRSPMGDLRFAYGIPLDEDRKGERPSGRFEFSMGQTF